MKKMEKALVVMTLLVAVMMTGATIATMQANQNQNSNGNRGNTMNSNMGAAMSASDTEFATMAAQGGIAEVQMAQLAQQKATSKDVQKYAKQMIKDHTKANNNLMKIAAKKQMTFPTTPNAEQMQMMSQLQQASGAEFDRMYIQMAGIDSHQKMQGLFQSEISGGTDADLKSFASKTLPTVQKHLRMAQEMTSAGMTGGNMNMSGGSMNSNMGGSMNGNMNGNMNSNNRNRNSNSNRNRNSNGNTNNSNR
jgi:putative membrane protein